MTYLLGLKNDTPDRSLMVREKSPFDSQPESGVVLSEMARFRQLRVGTRGLETLIARNSPDQRMIADPTQYESRVRW